MALRARTDGRQRRDGRWVTRSQPAIAAHVIVALGACYAPSIAREAPCDPDRSHCPLDQSCRPSASGYVCLRPGDVPVDAAVDAAASYVAVVLADKPSGYWRLGDMTAVAVDASGHGATGSYGSGITQGVPGAIVGDADTAAEFSGQTGAISVGNSFQFIGTAAFSIEAWIRPSLFDDVYRHVFTTQHRVVSNRQGYALLLHRPEGIVFERFVNDGQVTIEAGMPLSAASFTHIVVTYDGATLRLYVNGQLATSKLENRPQPPVDEPTLIGAASLAQGFFAGAIDEVAVYPSALDDAHVRNHYLVGTAR